MSSAIASLDNSDTLVDLEIRVDGRLSLQTGTDRAGGRIVFTFLGDVLAFVAAGVGAVLNEEAKKYKTNDKQSVRPVLRFSAID